MCGIFAAMTRRGLQPNRAEAALKALQHRGPDGSGLWTSGDGTWTLGHTRLSIVGLENGEQPLKSADGALHAVVNGEFYGYRAIRDDLRADGCKFSTDSDSEILLHLYQRKGPLATSDLRGEFAAVIADTHLGAMVAIRDRFGIKPLFYAVVDGEVFFASEVKALLALGVPAAWDLESVHAGLGHPHERTLFAGVRAVPPGCYAIARHGEVRIYSYWDWEIPTAAELRADPRSEAEVVADFREVLTDAVRQRLVADVEVACYLSGGIDSCAVLGLAQGAMDRPIRAFTLTFDDPIYDEGAIAEAQAKKVGAHFQPIPVTGREIADGFADAIWHTETTMLNGNGVAKFLLSRAVRDAGIKVVFTGEGADELLGGYPFFRVDAINHNPALSAEDKRALIDEMFGANVAGRAVMMPENVDTAGFDVVQRRLGWIPAWIAVGAALGNAVAPLYRAEFAARFGARALPIVDVLDRLPLAQRVAGRDHLNQSLYLNAKCNLPNWILTQLGDRMEMAHSIEGRVPFLDHHVAEAAARIPVDMKVRGMREKHVLREAARDVLIPEVYNRQKHAFTSPPTRSKDDPMMDFYRDTFASKAAREQPVFDSDKIPGVLDMLMNCPYDKRIAVESVAQRITSIIVMHERFGMA